MKKYIEKNILGLSGKKKMTKKEGILEACETMHKWCLKNGMECGPQEQIAYTKMIVFLNNKFGYLRQNND